MHVVVGVMALVATVVIVCMGDMVHWWLMREGGEGVVGMRGWRWSGRGRTCHHRLALSHACGAVVMVNSLSALSWYLLSPCVLGVVAVNVRERWWRSGGRIMSCIVVRAVPVVVVVM